MLSTKSHQGSCLLRTMLKSRQADGSKSCPRVLSDIHSESAGSCSLAEYKTGNPFNYLWSRRWGMCVCGWGGGLDERTVFQRVSLASVGPSVLFAIIRLLPCLYDLLPYFNAVLPSSPFFLFFTILCLHCPSSVVFLALYFLSLTFSLLHIS